MPSTHWKNPDRLDAVLYDLGYLLIYALSHLLLLAFVVVHFIVTALHLDTLCAMVWAWIFSTKIGRKIRAVCRFVLNLKLYHWMAVGFTYMFILCTAVTIWEQDEADIELLLLNLKSLVTPYLPALGFLAGIILTCAVQRFLPGYDRRSADLHRTLHAPKSIIDLFSDADNVLLPGGYPATLTPEMVQEIKGLILAKDEAISDLQNSLQKEDDELADLLVEKDEEITMLKELSLAKDKEISDLINTFQEEDEEEAEFVRMKDDRMDELQATLAACQEDRLDLRSELELVKKQVAPPTNPVALIAAAQDELKTAEASRMALEKKVAAYVVETDVLKKDISALQLGQRRQVQRQPIEPPNRTFFQVCRDQIVELESQLSQRGREADEAKSTIAHYNQQLLDVQSQLTQSEAELAKASQTIFTLQDKLTNVESKLGQSDSDRAKAHRSISTLQDQLTDANLSISTLQGQLNHGHFQNMAQQLQQAQNEVAIFKEGGMKLHAQYVECAAEFQVLREKYDTELAIGQDRIERIRALEELEKSLQGEIHDLKQTQGNWAQRVGRAEGKFDGYLKELAEARATIRKLQYEVENAGRSRSGLIPSPSSPLHKQVAMLDKMRRERDEARSRERGLAEEAKTARDLLKSFTSTRERGSVEAALEPKRPGKRRQEEALEGEGGREDGRGKRHQEAPVYQTGDPDLDSLFEDD